MFTELRDVQLRTAMEAKLGVYIAEGEKVIRRAVAAGHRPHSFLLAPRWAESLADVLTRFDVLARRAELDYATSGGDLPLDPGV